MNRSSVPALFIALAVLGTSLLPPVNKAARFQERSLEPVQRFERLSRSGDIDEGRFSRFDSFLSAGFREGQEPGSPGEDAPPQPLRRHPYGLALSVDGSKLYITLEGNEAEPGSSVLVIDTSSGEVAGEINVGRRPLGITRSPGGRFLIVANQYSNFLSVIDTTNDREVGRLPGFFYNQKIAFVPERSWMLVTNRALDSLEVFRYSEAPFTASLLYRISLWSDNRPYMLDNDPGFGLGGDHQQLLGTAPGFGNTDGSSPRDLMRHLTNVNPRDLAVSGNLVYVGLMNGLGVAIVDMDRRAQAASIDLNAPALDVATDGSFVFISTLSRFAQGFDNVNNEIAVVDTVSAPFSLKMRFTSATNPPYGPKAGPGRGTLVPSSGEAPYLTAFGVNGFLDFPRDRDVLLRIVDGFESNPDNLPRIVGGALPDQMVIADGKLAVAYAASDEVELFRIDSTPPVATGILTATGRAFTNEAQTAFPTTIDRRALFDDGPYIMGKNDPTYFKGRMPQEIVATEDGRRLFVANRLGESITSFRVSGEGQPVLESVIDLAIIGTPKFPATLAENGEDFYTSSRVSLDRDMTCQSCHPGSHKDSKIWHVASSPGRTMRMTLSNRNLRGTPPFYRSGIRRNLETFRGTFRSMASEGPFGFFESPSPFDANGDGVLNDLDRGRTVADVNRNRMFVLERTGVSFEKTNAAIAAFLEAEPRLLPNPFLGPGGRLMTRVPVAFDGRKGLAQGDAVRGKLIFSRAGCAIHHTPPTFTTNRTLGLEEGGGRDGDRDGIPDAVVRSLEQSLFDLMPTPSPTYQERLPRERLPFAGIDTDRRLNFANTPNTFAPGSSLPVSAASGRLLTNPLADTRNVNVPSLRGVWDGAPFLHHGRAASLIEVQGLFNDLGRHGNADYLGTFSPNRFWTNSNFLDLVAYLNSIE
jgi:YVTN family beta-propeller protein